MAGAIRTHIRSNVVGYLALFLTLTGGTAYALDGSNTVFSDDIVDREVKAADIAPNAIGTARIVNGGVANEDLAANAVTSAKVQDSSLTGADLADRTIGGQKIGAETLAGVNVNDGSLFGADIANESLRAEDIGTDAVGASEIAPDAVGANEIAPAAFFSGDITQVSATDQRYEIANNAVSGGEVGDNSLTGNDIAESTLATPEVAYSKTDDVVTLPDDDNERTIASRTVEPGSYLVLAKASLVSNNGEFVTCRINAIRPGVTSDIDRATAPTVKQQFGLPGAWDTIDLIGLVSSSGNIELRLNCRGAGVRPYNIRLVAIKVNRLIGTDAQ